MTQGYFYTQLMELILYGRWRIRQHNLVLEIDLYFKGIKKEHSPMLFLFLYDNCTCNKDTMEHQVQHPAAVFIHNSWTLRALASLRQKEESHSRQSVEIGLRPMLERENVHLE